MTSLSVRSHTYSPTMGGRQLSNVTLRTNSSGLTATTWRSEPLWRRKQKQIEYLSDTKLQDFRGNSPLSDARNKRDTRGHLPLRKFYVDQQTGEMRLSTTGRTVHQSLDDDIELETCPARRPPSEHKRRRRFASATTPPSVTRSFWDQSLKTKSILINSRTPLPPPALSGYLPRTAPPIHVGNSLPRISRSAETSSARYPRGQQRPTGLASGHHALLLRHRQIMEASRRPPCDVTWRKIHHKEENILDILRERHGDVEVRYLNPANHSLLRHRPMYVSFISPNDVTVQKRCSQEVTSLTKVNKKCKEWFNTWVED